MSERTVFQIHLDPSIIENFNEALDNHEHISEQLTFEGKKYRGVPAWDCICACVHRIRDTVEYLNDQRLGTMKYRSAFDFINFLSNAAVVLDSVDMLAEVLGVDLSKENARCEAFHQPGQNKLGNDVKYFRFLRSLCAVHPVGTSHYKGMYHEPEVVTCPYITWVRDSPLEFVWDCDIHANAFTNDANSWGEDICVHMDQLFSHIEYRYGLLRKIGAALERYQEGKIEEFRNTPIPGRKEGESESAYIERLKDVEAVRFGTYNDPEYEFAEKVFAFVPSDSVNNGAAERYASAWRFALSLQRNALQDMSRKGFEHGSIEGDDSGWILFENLRRIHCKCKELNDYGYQIEKIAYLDGHCGPRDAAWGRLKLGEIEPVFRKYVAMDLSHDSDEELYMLSRIALYEIALRHDCEINRAIPHSEEYRTES